MFLTVPHFLPKELTRQYRILQVVLYLGFFGGALWALSATLFPYDIKDFYFGSQTSKTNTLFLPHTQNFTPVTDGKIAQGDSLTLFANNWNQLERATVTVVPSKKSTSLIGSTVHISRSPAVSFFPQETTARSFPETHVFYDAPNDTYYEERSGTLFPYVSSAALASLRPLTDAKPLSAEQKKQFTLSDELLGFRVGTLLSYADGVFIVGENNTLHPFGSPEVLTRLGYSFGHVIPVSAEEVGIYRRGKILLPGDIHQSGTLLRDTVTSNTFLFTGTGLAPLSQEYERFLEAQSDVVPFSSVDQKVSNGCTLEQKTLSRAVSCSVSLLSLGATSDDYALQIIPTNENTDIAEVHIGLQASRQKNNALFILNTFKKDLYGRLGLAYE